MNVENDIEIMDLMNTAYQAADKYNLTKTRSPDVIQNLNELKNQLEKDLLDREKDKKEINEHRLAWQAWAERQGETRELSVKREKSEKMKRLQRALENPEVKDLLLKVMNRKITPQEAFDSIKANHMLKNQIQGLTLTGLNGTGKGGKSRVFRRKNKTTRSKSRRNVRRTQHTRTHQKSSTRRSTRK